MSRFGLLPSVGDSEFGIPFQSLRARAYVCKLRESQAFCSVADDDMIILRFRFRSRFEEVELNAAVLKKEGEVHRKSDTGGHETKF